MTEVSTKEESKNFVLERVNEANEYSDKAWTILEAFTSAMAEGFAAPEVPEIESGFISVDPDEDGYTFDSTLFTESLPEDPSAELTIDASSVARPSYNKQNVGSISLSAAPTFDADTPDTTLGYDELTYTSTLLDSLKAKLAVDIQGGTGMDEATEQAIYDRAARRLEREHDRRYSLAENRWGGAGFPLPNGFLNTSLREEINRHANEVEDLNNKILELSVSMEQENRKQVEAAVSQLEQILSAANDARNARRLDAAKTNVGSLIELYNAEAAKFNTLTQAWKVESDVELARFDGEIKQNEILASVYAEELKARGVDISALIEEVKAKADVYRTLMAGLDARATVLSRVEEAKLRAYETKSRLAISEAELALKQAEVAIQAALNKLGFDIETAKAGANVAAQIVAEAIGSVNASVGFSHSGSYSASETF